MDIHLGYFKWIAFLSGSAMNYLDGNNRALNQV